MAPLAGMAKALDFWLLFLLCILSSVWGQNSDERVILLELKKSFSDPYGILNSWKDAGSNHCSWYGVSCNSDIRVSGLKIGGNFSLAPSCSLYSELSLHGFGIGRNCGDSSVINGRLGGRISSVIGKLTELRVLSLPYNNLHGEIPVEIWGLKNLEVLDLEGNRLFGHFSGFDFSGLRKLGVLNLGFNRILGQFPPSLSECRGLRILNLAGNGIDDVIPGFVGRYRKLRVLNLSFNRLVGVIPSDIGYDCQNQEHLDLSANFLKGEIPRALGKCGRLRTISLSSNTLSGVIPNELGNIRSLEVLDLSRNRLRGPLPANLGCCTDLSVLVLTDHFNAPSLKRFPRGEASLVDHNSFEGPIPEEITSLPKLEILWAPGAYLEGKFPSTRGKKLIPPYDPSVAYSSFFSYKLLSESAFPSSQTSLSLIYDFSLNNSIQKCESSAASALNVHKNGLSGSIPEPELRSNSSNHRPSTVALACLISGSSLIIICLVLLAYLYCAKKKRQNISAGKKVTLFTDIGVPLTYGSIVVATENFNTRNRIGSGGFGYTYKAEIAPGNIVAIKRLSAGRRHQGPSQFNAEINTLGRTHHPNLITLIGYYCSEGEMFLIYNYLSGGNLEQFIRDRAMRPFNWPILHKIALHIACALSYLHDECTPCILHRDIKPGNILLDADCNAYLSDFGLSKILLEAETGATTPVAGTYGYIAPEYASTGHVCNKADVYSYGVVLLELMSDKRTLDPSFFLHEDGFNIVSWASMLLRQKKAGEVFMPVLWNAGPKDKLVKLLHVALMCTVETVAARPPMNQVVNRLKQIGPPPDG